MDIPIEHSLAKLTSLPQIDLSAELIRTRDAEVRAFQLCSRPEDEWSLEDREFMQSLIRSYSPNKYSKSEFDSGFYVVSPAVPVEIPAKPSSATVADIDTYWDQSKFLEPRSPFCIGHVENREQYDLPAVARCLHLPVKFPQLEIRVPNEYRQFEEVIQKIFNFERAFNPSYEDYYAYLTVDQRFVPRGESQRLPGAHVDGIPRDVGNPSAQKIDHCYVVTNNLPTRFFVHPFPIAHYDPKEINLFAAMRYFADESQAVDTRPYEINLMNAYSVHSAALGNAHVYRTFLRIEFSVLQFDRIGNAVNPYFEYTWSYRPCPIPPSLSVADDIMNEIERGISRCKTV